MQRRDANATLVGWCLVNLALMGPSILMAGWEKPAPAAFQNPVCSG